MREFFSKLWTFLTTTWIGVSLLASTLFVSFTIGAFVLSKKFSSLCPIGIWAFLLVVFLFIYLRNPKRRFFRIFSVTISCWLLSFGAPTYFVDFQIPGYGRLLLFQDGLPMIAHIVVLVLCSVLLLFDFLERRPVLPDEKGKNESGENISIGGINMGAANISAGHDVNISQSFMNTGTNQEDDRDIFLNLSASMLQIGSQDSGIHSPNGRLHIERLFINNLIEASDICSFAIMGEPGAGKSGVLHDLALRFQEQGRTVIYLIANRLSSSSIGSLRNEIGLTALPENVLGNWNLNGNPGYFLIDAMDVSRAEDSVSVLLDLITLVKESETGWKIIATVREYDLRHNVRMQQVFSGMPPIAEFSADDFQSVCHFVVPQLGTEDRESLEEQYPPLGVVHSSASPELSTLLNNLFNVRLVVDLLSTGIQPCDLVPIQTQLELLDRYWCERVSASPGSQEVLLLQRACQAMLDEKTISCSSSSIVGTQSKSLQTLLSRNVLRTHQHNSDLISFSHQILLEYAIARLIFRTDTDSLLHLLDSDYSILFSARPSLQLHFEHLWYLGHDRLAFWEATQSLGKHTNIPLIGKIVPLVVAAEHAGEYEDVSYIIDLLTSQEPENIRIAEFLFQHLIGSIIATSETSLDDCSPRPWAELLDRISEVSDFTKIFYDSERLLGHLVLKCQ